MDEALRTDARRAREAVRVGRLRGGALLDVLAAVPFEHRDAWVDALLALPELPEDQPDLPRGAVPYLPCGVDAIVRAVREAPVGPGDVFVDLGSGLGRVAVLTHLLSGARAVGVEMQPHLAAQARATAAGLGVDAVTFLTGDAAEIDVREGTVFFIYASFGLATLARVLSRLESMARRRRILLCAVDFEVHDRPWLRPRASDGTDLVCYESWTPPDTG